MVGEAKNQGDPRGFRIERRIEIATPAETIWALISDLEGWRRWNPLYPEATRVARVGETLTATIALPGMKPNKFRSVISEWAPNKQLQWRVSNAGGLMRMTRYMRIEPLTEQSCAFANGEIFGGPLGPATARMLESRVQEGFRLMNEALKEAAEARSPAR
jgi:hypothetical protein